MKPEKLAIKIIEITENKTYYSRQMRIIETTKLINQFKEDIEKNVYPNTLAKDGEIEFCGKCGTVI